VCYSWCRLYFLPSDLVPHRQVPAWIFLPQYQLLPRFVSQLVTRMFSILGAGLLICFSIAAMSFSPGFLSPIRQRRPGFNFQLLILSFCDERCCSLDLVLCCAGIWLHISLARELGLRFSLASQIWSLLRFGGHWQLKLSLLCSCVQSSAVFGRILDPRCCLQLLDKKPRSFIVLIALNRLFFKHIHKVFGEMSVRSLS
jgi:hypothetical protein